MSSVFNNNTFTGGAYVYLYENQEQNIDQLIQQALTPYITTTQAITLFVSKTAFDNSYNEIINIVNNIDASINVIVSRLDDVDASLNQIVGEISILDASLNNEIIRNNNQDISINNLQTSVNNIIIDFDNSFNQLSGEISILDNSLNNEIIRNDNQDISINNLQTSLNNLNVDIDASLNTKVNKAGDNMTGNLVMGFNRITQLGDPINDFNATHKKYVDDADNLKLNLTGGTMSGLLTLNNALNINFQGEGAVVKNPSNNGRTVFGTISAGAFIDLFNDSNVNNVKIRSYPSNNIAGWINSGNFGLGTTSPSFRLDVNGSLRTTGESILGTTRISELTPRDIEDNRVRYITTTAGATRRHLFRRYRSGGSNPQGQAGVCFSNFETSNFYMFNTGTLRIGYSGSLIDTTTDQMFDNTTQLLTLSNTGDLGVVGNVSAENPTSNNHLSTKQYTDTYNNISGVSFSGRDGTNANWDNTEITSTSSTNPTVITGYRFANLSNINVNERFCVVMNFPPLTLNKASGGGSNNITFGFRIKESTSSTWIYRYSYKSNDVVDQVTFQPVFIEPNIQNISGAPPHYNIQMIAFKETASPTWRVYNGNTQDLEAFYTCSKTSVINYT